MPPVRLKPLSDDLPLEVHRFAARLRECFAEVDESISSYARSTGVDSTTVRRYLHGQRIPSPSFVSQLLTSAADRQGKAVALEEIGKAQEMRLEALRAVDRIHIEVEKIRAQAAVADLQKAELDEQIAIVSGVISSLGNEGGSVVGGVRELESSQTKQALEAPPKIDGIRYEANRKALVRAEGMRYDIESLRSDLKEAKAARALAERRCQQLEEALKEAHRRYVLVADLVGRPDLNMPQSIAAYVDKRRLRWGGIVGMCIGPLILYVLPAYLGVMYQMVSKGSPSLRMATLVGLFIPVWFGFGIKRLERAGLPRAAHLLSAIVTTAIIFFVFTLLPDQLWFVPTASSVPLP